MFDLPRHKVIGMLLKDMQAGPCTKVDSFTAIHGARKALYFLEDSTTRGFGRLGSAIGWVGL